ncbi:molybdate ABC transporter substrate-binding protein [Agromyces archimandritae]|uniref:Molybdate ABC transporter substrate-binding protein n=1 Tax=Agromyces archimandritae TaxID=2781962 RepID=A0A975FJX0_9MICO|nr:molybdate ABC transporter substrate-binding protein [Agromyces archimandritae]QTX03870.1 molybdate ABC transporter substrate-binding protein [Agromyces archimandritae]
MTRTPARLTAAVGAAAVLAALTGCTASGEASETVVTVYAAASLTEAFTELEAAYEAANPDVDVQLVFDGSSTLATQIVEGADAQVFAAADERTMAQVVDAGAAADPEIFAGNELRLLTPAGDPAGVEALLDLARPGVRVVVCAPEVPCGAAATELLELAKVEITPASEEQNVSAVVAKLVAGEADAGLAYATDAKANPELEAITPVLAGEVRNRYPIAALGDEPSAEAQGFVDLVLGDEGRRVLASYGFLAP